MQAISLLLSGTAREFCVHVNYKPEALLIASFHFKKQQAFWHISLLL